MKLFICLFVFFSLKLLAEDKSFVVVIPSYNNQMWATINIRSVLNQKYSNYRVIYIDDASVDNTGYAISYCVNRARSSALHSTNFDETIFDGIEEATFGFRDLIDESYFFNLIHNEHRCGALANQYRAIHSCKDDEIIVLLDGDDWLLHDGVLAELNRVYQDKHVWLTHGSLEEYPIPYSNWCISIPDDVIADRSYRQFRCPSHLRTFYAGLFKRIKLKDLMYEDNFFPMTSDMAIMFPLIEMASERHAFISNPNYVYNMANPINDNKIDAHLQVFFDEYIRALPPYQRLKRLPFLEKNR